jgi:hypothetical protein
MKMGDKCALDELGVKICDALLLVPCTLAARAAAGWLFFRVARSTRMTQIWALRSRLEKQPTDLRPYASYI